jgi:hypothetical protein
MTHQIPVPAEHIYDTQVRLRDVGPVVPVEFPGGVAAWAARRRFCRRGRWRGRSGHLQRGAAPAGNLRAFGVQSDAELAGLLWRILLADTTQDTTLAGVSLPARAARLMFLSATLTDPVQHCADADRFDISRTQQPGPPFGHGPQFCLTHYSFATPGPAALPVLLR